MEKLEYSTNELMAVAGSHELEDGKVIAVGIGLPQIASVLAKHTHAPNATLILEIGAISPVPVSSGVGIADPRLWYRSTCLTSFVHVLGMGLHRGLIDYGFLGALEMDMYGNVNTTLVYRDDGSMRHFVGSGGANDFASLSNHMIIMMRHDKRKFPEKVKYITCPGFLTGGNSRVEAGLKGGGPLKVITNLGVMGFDDETKRMNIVSVHPGVTVEKIQENTGFELLVPDTVGETTEPTVEELRLIREEIDPNRDYI